MNTAVMLMTLNSRRRERTIARAMTSTSTRTTSVRSRCALGQDRDGELRDVTGLDANARDGVVKSSARASRRFKRMDVIYNARFYVALQK